MIENLFKPIGEWDIVSMNKKITLKFKLLLYYLLVQIILFIVFGGVTIHMLESSVKEKLETNLKIIILDIKDDLIHHHKIKSKISLGAEIEEFDMKPLDIRIIIDNETLQTKGFPHTILIDESLENDKVYFRSNADYIWGNLKFYDDNTSYQLQVITPIQKLIDIFPNLLYIFLLIVPLTLFLAIIMGNILIAKSFRPIENLLNDIEDISAKDFSKRVHRSYNNDEIDMIGYEINNLLQRVENAYFQVSQFTSDASHELKTPLTIMQGELEVLLKETRSEDEYKKSIYCVLDEVSNIRKIIDALILLAKVDEKLQMNEDIYLDEIIFEVIGELRVLSEQKKIVFETNISDPITISGNEKLLKIALKNLVENAIFYSYENSKVIIELQKINNNFELRVIDSGIGMSEETCQNIFDKFYRSDESRSKNTGGFGLGMSIAKKIADIHNLEIKVKSSLDKGSKFILKMKN